MKAGNSSKTSTLRPNGIGRWRLPMRSNSMPNNGRVIFPLAMVVQLEEANSLPSHRLVIRS
jgi:hypothetical protein